MKADGHTTVYTLDGRYGIAVGPPTIEMVDTDDPDSVTYRVTSSTESVKRQQDGAWTPILSTRTDQGVTDMTFKDHVNAIAEAQAECNRLGQESEALDRKHSEACTVLVERRAALTQYVDLHVAGAVDQFWRNPESAPPAGEVTA